MAGQQQRKNRPVPTNNDQLADAKYEPPEVSDSESEDEQPAEDEGDLWGAIMGT